MENLLPHSFYGQPRDDAAASQLHPFLQLGEEKSIKIFTFCLNEKHGESWVEGKCTERDNISKLFLLN